MIIRIRLIIMNNNVLLPFAIDAIKSEESQSRPGLIELGEISNIRVDDK